jgi:hypothetical protein
MNQIELCPVRTAIDNFLCVRVIDAGQGFKLIFGGGVEIELVGPCGSGGLCGRTRSG